MIASQLLDPVPVIGVFLGFAVVALVVFEIGYRVGVWWQRRTPDHKEGPTGMLVGSILALLAFLLAVTMGMAADRFDTRRALVLTEANAIGTTYLRAGYLPEPYATNARRLLRVYVPLRVNSADAATFGANQVASGKVLELLWADVEAMAPTEGDSPIFALYVETLNETIDLENARGVAVLYARVPETVLLMLLLGEVLTMGVVGYSAGLAGSRGVLSAVVLVIVLGAVLTLVVDLDRPRDGFLTVNQQPMIDLAEQIGS
jgi:hypothetical protein